MRITKRQLRRIIREAFAAGRGDIKVGDKVFYRGPQNKGASAGSVPTLTVTRLYNGGKMAEVLHDNGYTYKGYIVANMTKAEDAADPNVPKAGHRTSTEEESGISDSQRSVIHNRRPNW